MKRIPDNQISFLPSSAPAKNPFIGFTSYQRFRGDPLYSDLIVRPENNGTETEITECYPVDPSAEEKGSASFYPDAEVAYVRLLWKDFEPQRKKYNYALISDILEKARAKGQTVMFRLMPHSTRKKDDVPEWLKGMIPCPDRPEGARVKDSPEDPLFLDLFGEAIEAVAARFDTDPTLDVVDLSLTGAWGEGHRVNEYPKEALMRLADRYTKGFQHTRLIGQVAAPWLIKYASKRTPCGWRGDGVGEEKHMTVMYPKAEKELSDLWKKAPVSFESYWWLGEWERRGWKIDDIIEKTLSWHVSTFNAKSFPIPEKWKEKVAYWLSKMGYHFCLTSVCYPSCGNVGDTFVFDFSIENRGVAPIYHPIPLRLSLKGEGETRVFTTTADPRVWLPGTNKERIEISIPNDLPAGEYSVGLTLSGENTPVVEWETQGERDENYLLVCRITVNDPRKALSGKRGYLQGFLEEFGFDGETKRAVQDAFDRLIKDETAAALLEETRKTYLSYPDKKFRYVTENAEKIAEKCGINKYTAYLLTLLLLSEETKEVYQKRGVGEEIRKANLFDLKYTADLCLPMKGVPGTYCPDWYDRFFAATRVSFGKLQFEVNPLGKGYRKNGVRLKKSDPVIFIHIPRTGERLSPSDVDDACRQAARYFEEKYKLAPVVFACHSWLLYPFNKTILSPDSNLYSFFSRFDIIAVDEDKTYRDLWRLFDREYTGNADELPEDTSLRRAYKARVKAKKKLGVGLGVWVYKASR